MTFETDAAGNIRHDEPNEKRIETIWACLSTDANGEGLMVVPVNGVSMPLITAKPTNLPALKRWAQEALAELGSGKGFRVVRFERAGEELGE